MMEPSLTKIRDVVRSWYQGVFVPHENDPYSSVVLIGGWYKRHWTASAARIVAEFWLKYWQWVIGVIIAISAILYRK